MLGTQHVVVAVMAVLVLSCVAVKPGFRIALTTKGLDYINQVGAPILQKELSSLTIPDISGHASIVGIEIDYTLTSVLMTGLKFPVSSLTPESTGLVIRGSSMSAHIHADWHYRESDWPHVSDSGSVDVDASEMTLVITVSLGKDSKGHATLATTGCTFVVDHLDIDIHGGASWLYNLFDSYIADQVKDAMKEIVCQQASAFVNTVGSLALESLPVIIKLDKTSEINYELVAVPTINTTYVETNHKGEFFSISHPVEAPYTPSTLPPVKDGNNRMMYIWLTEYLANTAGFVYQGAGVMQYNITPNMVPKDLPFQLNTSSFRPILPQLYSKYPNMAMVLDLVAFKPPTVSVLPKTANIVVPGHVRVYVVDPKNGTQLAFILGTAVYADVRVWLHANGTKEVVSANTTLLKTDLSLIESNIGNFSVGVLQDATDLLVSIFVIPTLNHYANAGVPIPTIEGIALTNSTVTMDTDFVVIDTDFIYNPSFLRRNNLTSMVHA